MEELRDPSRFSKLHESKELGDREHIERIRPDLPRDAVPGTRNAENTFLRLGLAPVVNRSLDGVLKYRHAYQAGGSSAYRG